MNINIDIDSIVAPIESPASDPKMLRMSIRRIRDGLYQQAESYFNFQHFGPEWDGQESPPAPDWHELNRECEKCLSSQSKDLWVAVWLVEGLLLKYGFPGLAKGFEILNRLVSECWDSIEPSPSSEDGMEYTVLMLAGMDKDAKFIDCVNAAPISAEAGEPPRALTCATLTSEDEGLRGSMLANTSLEDKILFVESADAAHEHFLQLVETVSEKCGDDAPPSFKVREGLKRCVEVIKGLYPEALPADEAEGAEGAVDESGQPVAGGGGGFGGPIANREDAFRQLEQVSAFFRKTEPHSPVSYALEKTVRLGRMDLPALLSDLIDDDSTKEQIFRLIGIVPEPENYD